MDDGVGPRELPAGTVTVLLTDIDAATRPWDEPGWALASAVEGYDEIVDAAVQLVGGAGLVGGGEGGSSISAFGGVWDALRAAAAAHRDLQREFPWLPVRMALHTGEAVWEGDRPDGPTIKRCVELGAIGHGGQILVSATTAAIAAERGGDDGFEWVDLGVQRRAGLASPQRVWQLVVLGEHTRPAPLRTLDRAGRGLARSAGGWTSLTPTEREVAQLVADGLTNHLVAERLFVSRATVKTHLAHIFRKTGVTNRTELARRLPEARS